MHPFFPPAHFVLARRLILAQHWGPKSLMPLVFCSGISIPWVILVWRRSDSADFCSNKGLLFRSYLGVLVSWISHPKLVWDLVRICCSMATCRSGFLGASSRSSQVPHPQLGFLGASSWISWVSFRPCWSLHCSVLLSICSRLRVIC